MVFVIGMVKVGWVICVLFCLLCVVDSYFMFLVLSVSRMLVCGVRVCSVVSGLVLLGNRWCKFLFDILMIDVMVVMCSSSGV